MSVFDYEENPIVLIPTEITPLEIFPTEESLFPPVTEISVAGSTDFYVDYYYNSPEGIRVNLSADFPQGAVIEYTSDGVTGGKTVIKYLSREVLALTIPPIGFPLEVDEYVEIADARLENLYRVVSSHDDYEYYSNELSLVETCAVQDSVINPPCASPNINFQGEQGDSLYVEFVGDPEDREVADAIMRTLEVK